MNSICCRDESCFVAFCIHAHFFAFVRTWERDALMWVMEIQGRKQKQIEEESYVLVP